MADEDKRAAARARRQSAKEKRSARRGAGKGKAEGVPSVAAASFPDVPVPSAPAVRLPATLNPRQRSGLHRFAERRQLCHVSADLPDERRVLVLATSEREVPDVTSDEAQEKEEREVDDAAACELVRAKLGPNAAGLSAMDMSNDADMAPPQRNDSTAKQPPPHLVSAGAFATASLPLIELEQKAEEEEAATAVASGAVRGEGRILKPLALAESHIGFMGRHVLTLHRAGGAAVPLPAHAITPHDIVHVRLAKSATGGEGDASGNEPLCSGVVSRLTDSSISVMCDDLSESAADAVSKLADGSWMANLRLEKVANETTYQRYRKAMQMLSRCDEDSAGEGPTPVGLPVAEVAFGRRIPRLDAKLFAELEACREAEPSTVQSLPGDGEETPGPSLRFFFNPRLDESQRRAVTRALACGEVALVHGPPGTGKTTTLVELILQMVVRQRRRILVSCASNAAVDNLCERLHRALSALVTGGAAAEVAASATERDMALSAKALEGLHPSQALVRVGHVSRLHESVLTCALEYRVDKSHQMELARDIKTEMNSLHKKLYGGDGKSRIPFAERRAMRGEYKTLRKEYGKRCAMASDDVLGSCRICCTTLSTALGGNLQKFLSHRRNVSTDPSQKVDGSFFDVCVIDEAAQALEVACWGALLQSPRCVLAGDHHQLPPTVTSADACKRGFDVTLFSRLMSMRGSESFSQMLEVQYRMHHAIMDWSSREFYGCQLVADPSVYHHALWRSPEVKMPAIAFVDTSGVDGCEEAEDDAGSRMNRGEAAIALEYACALCGIVTRHSRARGGGGDDAGAAAIVDGVGTLTPRDVGVIAPYNAQVALLKELRSEYASAYGASVEALEVSTVDSFQGREKAAIVLTLVRSNSQGEVGFLSDARRLNVAITRAQRHLCVIADGGCVGSRNAFLKRVMAHLEERADYRCGDELLPLDDAL